MLEEAEKFILDLQNKYDELLNQGHKGSDEYSYSIQKS